MPSLFTKIIPPEQSIGEPPRKWGLSWACLQEIRKKEIGIVFCECLVSIYPSSEKKENSFIPSPICPSFSCCMDVCFPSKVPSMLSHCCPFRYGPTVLFRPFLMNRWFHDSGCSLSSIFSSVKAPNYTYTMHSAGKQPGHETAFGSICVPLWHEISALLSWFHCSSRSLECY